MTLAVALVTGFAWLLITSLFCLMRLRAPDSYEHVTACPLGLKPSSWQTMNEYRRALFAEGFVSSGLLVARFAGSQPHPPMLLEGFEHPSKGHRAGTMALFDHPNIVTMRPTLSFTSVLADGSRLEVINAPTWLLTTNTLIEHPFQFPYETDAQRLYAFYRAILTRFPSSPRGRAVPDDGWIDDLKAEWQRLHESARARGHILPTSRVGEYRMSIPFAARFSWTLMPSMSSLLLWWSWRRNRRLIRELQMNGTLAR